MSTNDEAQLQDLAHCTESEARYQRLVTRMSALVFELAPDGTLIFVNDAVMPIMGYRPDEMQGRNWWNLVVPDDERSTMQDLLGRFQLGDVTGHELKLKAKDGSPIWLELDSANHYAVDGTLQSIVGLGIDRTRHKRIEQEKNTAMHDLGERVKELTVLQRALYLLQDHARPIAELLQELLESLPSAFQFPGITAARIVLGDEVFSTPNYAPSPWMLWADLNQYGIIEVCYLDERPVEAEGPFLAQERAVLNTLAEMLQMHLERRQVEQERNASEVRFRTLAETTSAAIFIVEGLRILYANDAAHNVTGYTRDELLNMELWQLAHPTYQDILRQDALQPPWSETIPNRFELRVVTRGGEDRWWDVTTGNIEYEGKPALVVTAFDITERDRAEKELQKAKKELEVRVAERTAELRQAAEHLQAANADLQVQAKELEAERWRYRALFDFAPGGYLVTDLDGTIREANRAAAKILNVRADWLVGKPLMVYVNEQEHPAFSVRLAELQKAHTAQTWEVRLTARDGESFPALVDVEPARDVQGWVVGLRWLLRDITERKRAEDEIASLARFLTENPNPVLRVSQEGQLLYANEASDALLQDWGCVVGGQVPEYWRNLVATAFTGRSEKRVEAECQERVYSFVVVPIVEAGYVNLYARDITERKQAEEQLRYQAALLANVNDAIVASDAQYRLTAWNAAAESLYGWKAEEVLGQNGLEVMRTEWPVEDAVEMRRTITGVGHWRGEATQARKDGTRVSVEVSSMVLRDKSGQITGYVSVNRDITERKRAEEALRESEARLRLANELLEAVTAGTNVIIAAQDTDLRYIFFNTAYKEEIKRLTGKDLQIGSSLVELFADMPEQQEIAVTEWHQPLRGESTNKTIEFGDPSGYHRIYNVLHTPVRDAEGNVVGAGEVAYDVTEQVRTQQALRESEERYRSLFEGMTEGFALHEVICDEQGQPCDYRFLEINPSFERLTGLKREDVVGRTHNQALPDDSPLWVERYGQVALTGQPVQFDHYSPALKRHYEVFAYRPAPRQFAVLFVDITERKQIEEQRAQLLAQVEQERNRVEALARALKAERDLLQVVMENTRTHLAYLDPQFNFVLVNAAYAQGSGHTKAELVGRNHFDLFPNLENQAIFQRVVDTGQPVEFHAKPFKFADQPWRGVTYWDWALVPVKDQHGQVQGLAFSLEDMTENVRAAEDLRRARDELELRVQERTRELAQANEELRRASAYNRSLIEASLDPLMTIGPDGKITDVNRGTELVTGCSRAELVGTDFSDYFTQPEKARAGYQQVFREGAVRDYELAVRHWDGRVTPVLYSASVYRDEAGQVVGVFAAARDITERKQAEEALKAERQRFNDVLEMLPAYLLLLSPDYHVPFANRYFRERFGESNGRCCYEYLFGRNEPCEVCETYKVLKSNAPIEWEWTGPDGRDYNVFDFPFTDSDGSPLILEMGIDVTERKRAEEELRLRGAALEAAANGIIITDQQGNIQWSNPAFTQMTGYSLQEVLGQNPRLLKSGQQPPEFYRHLWETIHSGRVWRGEIVDRRKDASLCVEEMTIAPVLNERGEITHFVAVKQDVTERKRAEAQLEQNNRELRALSEAERKARRIAETLAAANLALTRTLDLDAVMETLLDHVGQLVPYDSANIMLLETESRLAVRVIRGYERWTDPQRVRAITFDAQASPIFRMLLDAQKSVLVPDTRASLDWQTPPGTEHVRNWLGVPIVAAGRVIGVYSLDKVEPNFFTGEHVRLAEALVGQAAVAIQNAWLFTQVRAGRERLQSLSRRLVEVQEAERHYVARELHDEAGQALTSLMFGLGQLEQELDRPQRAARVAGLKVMTNEVLESLHRLAMDLRPASLDHLGLEPALNQYVTAIGRRYGLIAQFKAVGLLGKRLPAAMETALYRIVQEALTNAARHAHATRVDVLLERRGDQVVIVVEDNGIGFEADLARLAQSGHLGLVGMQERAEMLGGSLVIESAAGAGTTVVVEVPYVD